MSERDTVAVVGLGLIGGSIARDLAARGVRVAGFDADTAALDAAYADGIIADRLERSLAGLAGATTVILAVPVSATPEVLQAAAKHLGNATLVTDVGSTKRSALAAAISLGLGRSFVGSHPMAGDHRSGWSASRTGLFSGAPTYLCATPSTRAEALVRARELWMSLGARPVVIDADAHDERVAFTSHMPHALSAALALALSRAKIGGDGVGPGGRDMLRIAGSSPDMWTAILADNADEILSAVAALRVELERFEQALSQHDARSLHGLFSEAQAWTLKAHVDIRT
jgi:prephenate dehydrogenase